MKFHRGLLIRSTSKLSLKIYFFAIFLVPSWFLRSMGAVPQNWLIPQKFHKKQSCRVSKSKIIMCLWSVALKARKAAKWPRTFYMVWTVYIYIYIRVSQIFRFRCLADRWCISWNVAHMPNFRPFGSSPVQHNGFKVYYINLLHKSDFGHKSANLTPKTCVWKAHNFADFRLWM